MHILKNKKAVSGAKSLSELRQQIDSVVQADSILLGSINDIHFDSKQSPKTQQSIQGVQLLSQFSRNYGLDAIIANGDLIDGNQPRLISLKDTKTVLLTLQESGVPIFITQGNHDDNSGFARNTSNFAGEIISERSSWLLHREFNQDLLSPESNITNPILYGKYKIPNSNVAIIILNTFDIPDATAQYKSTYYDVPSNEIWVGGQQNIRHGRSRIQKNQADWLTKTLDDLKPSEKVIIFTHASIRSSRTHNAVGTFKTYDWFVNNQQGYYAPVYDSLIKHQSQIIAVMNGHSHLDDWSKEDGINWISTTCAASDRGFFSDQRTLGSADETAWDILVINPSSRELYRFRYGWADPSGLKLTHTNFNLKKFFKKIMPRFVKLFQIFSLLSKNHLQIPIYRNNNTSKYNNSVWHGYKNYFHF